MLSLFFGSTFSIITTVLVILVFAFILLMLSKEPNFGSWGKAILLLIIMGMAVSGTSAMRDGYAGPEALFSMSSAQSNICSMAGGLVLIIGLASLFIRKRNLKRGVFFSVSALFILQVAVIEVSRISLNL